MMMNPVLRRETRTTLRNWKLFVAIAVYVGITILVAGLYMWNAVFFSYRGGFNPSDVMYLYILLAALQLGLVLITTPALTAGSISGERERQTLDLMLVTKMSPFSIIAGKLMSCLSLVFLMILASVPVFAIVFYFGGVSLFSLLGMTLFMLSVSCMIGAVSIFVSTLLKKTAMSMVLVYLFVGFLCVGTLILYMIFQLVHWNMYQEAAPAWVGFVTLLSNPGAGFVGVIDAQLGYNNMSSLINMFYYVGDSFTFANYFWIFNIVFNLAVCLLFMLFAAKRIQPLKRRGTKAKKKPETAKPPQTKKEKTA